MFIYKAILGKIPGYLSSFLVLKDGVHNLRSLNFVQFVVPRVWTEMGKKAFRFSAPFGRNNLQTEFKLQNLVSLNVFKSAVKTLEPKVSECRCFHSWSSSIMSLCYMRLECICSRSNYVLLPFLVRSPLKKRSLIWMGQTWLNKG